MSKTLYFIGTIVLIVIAVGIFTYQASNKPVEIKNVDPDTLPGIMTSEAPWQPEFAHLRDRLDAIGLPALSAEGSVLHIHQHIDIFVHGEPVSVPSYIGINGA